MVCRLWDEEFAGFLKDLIEEKLQGILALSLDKRG